jgi:hypothetical protein
VCLDFVDSPFPVEPYRVPRRREVRSRPRSRSSCLASPSLSLRR